MKEGANILLYDEDRPVMVYWGWGSGKVLWTGLRLPYLIMLHQDEKNAKLLTNILHFMSPAKQGKSRCSVQFESPDPESIVVHVEGASPREAIWVKMSYYPGWSAEIIGERRTQLRIFRAGPGMMLVFPRHEGSYDIAFYYGKTWDVMVGEAVSLTAILAILGFFIYRFITYLRGMRSFPERWVKTEHTGSWHKEHGTFH